MVDMEYRGSRILLIEDEESLATGIEYNLTEEGYSVTWVDDGRKARDIFLRMKFDLVVLDIMLPYLDGFQLAEIFREKDPQLPILILTARSSVEDRLRGFDIGADDYLVKPFHLNELLARIKGMLRRSSWYRTNPIGSSVFRIGQVLVDFHNLKVIQGEMERSLTQQEARLLLYLAENRNRIVSRKELLDKVWHLENSLSTRTVDNFVLRLRKLIEPNPAKPVYIRSVRGVGYRFTLAD